MSFRRYPFALKCSQIPQKTFEDFFCFLFVIFFIVTHIAQKFLKCSSGPPNHPWFLLILKWQGLKFLSKTLWLLPEDSNPIFIRRSYLLSKTFLRTSLGSHETSCRFLQKWENFFWKILISYHWIADVYEIWCKLHLSA